MSYAGLGEVLPTGKQYGDRNFMAQMTANWQSLQSGATVGGNFQEFMAAVQLGWVPNTPEGFDAFQYWFTLPTGQTFAAGLPEFVGWSAGVRYATMIRQDAMMGANGLDHLQRNWGSDITSFADAIAYAPKLWTNEARAYLANGVSAAAVQTATDAFNKYFAYYLTASVPTWTSRPWTGQEPIAQATPGPVAGAPNPAYPVGIQLLEGASSPGSRLHPNVALRVIVGWRPVTVYSGTLPEGGNTKYGAWEPLPGAYVVRDGPMFSGSDATKGWWPLRSNVTEKLPWAAQMVADLGTYGEGNFPDRAFDVRRGEAGLTAWLQSKGYKGPINASWATPALDSPWIPIDPRQPDGSLTSPLTPADTPPAGSPQAQTKPTWATTQPTPGPTPIPVVQEPIAMPPSVTPERAAASGSPSGGDGVPSGAGTTTGGASGSGKPFPWLLAAVGAYLLLRRRA